MELPCRGWHPARCSTWTGAYSPSDAAEVVTIAAAAAAAGIAEGTAVEGTVVGIAVAVVEDTAIAAGLCFVPLVYRTPCSGVQNLSK